MSTGLGNPPTAQIQDTVAKVDGEVAVGEDLEFQRKWWAFERTVWVLFGLILLLDVLGAFGRGPVAKAQRSAADNSLVVKYDRIQRLSTPSIITVDFGPSVMKQGRVELYASDSLVKELGAQRVIPSPEHTVVGDKGLTYTYLTSVEPASVEFAVEPTGPGMRHLTIQVQGFQPVHLDIFVMP